MGVGFNPAIILASDQMRDRIREKIVMPLDFGDVAPADTEDFFTMLSRIHGGA